MTVSRRRNAGKIGSRRRKRKQRRLPPLQNLDFQLLEARRVLTGPWVAIADQLTVDNQDESNLVFVNEALNSSIDALQADLPVIGNSVAELTNGEDFIGNAVGALDQSLRSLPATNATVEEVQNAIFASLGDEGGVNVLGDRNGNGNIEPSDIDVVVGDDVSVSLDLHRTVSFNGTFSTGLPGLPLKVDTATVEGTLSFDFTDFNFGFSGGEVFLETSESNELVFSIDAMASATNVVGSLGFLEVVASTNDGPTAFHGQLHVDISGDIDSGFDLSDPSMTANANVNFDLGVFLSTTRTSEDAMLLPALSSQFVLDWVFQNETDLNSVNDQFGQSLTVGFENVRVHLGVIAQEILSPIMDDIKSLTDPFAPVLDLLNEPIPLVSDIAGYLGGSGDYNLLDIIEFLDGSNVLDSDADALLTLIRQTTEIVNGVRDLSLVSEDSVVSLGSFSLEGEDTDMRNLGLVDYQSDTFAQTEIVVGNSTPSDTSVFSQLEDVVGSQTAALFAPSGDRNEFFDVSFPIFEDPESGVFDLLAGNDVDLVRLEAGFGENGISFQSSPIPLFSIGIATIDFTPPSLTLDADIGMGFDTFGMRQLISGGTSASSASLLDGFYLDTDSFMSVSFAADLGISGNYFFLSGRAAGEIGLNVELNVDSSGVNIDGDSSKLRFRSLNNQQEWGDCLFEITGGLTAGLNFEVKIGVDIPLVGFVGVSFSENIGGEIFSFGELACINPFEAPENTALATMDQSGILRLNVGADAHHRNFEGNDIDEKYVISADPEDPENSIQISAFGILQTYPRPEMISADAGDGQDYITIRSNVGDLDVEIYGGDDNDVLIYEASGTALLDGENGSDLIFGGSGLNLLVGGFGDDRIEAGQSVDSRNFIDGGTGADVITGKNGDNQIEGGPGNDEIHAGPNGDMIRGGSGNDRIFLGDGNDVAFGDAGEDSFDWFSLHPLSLDDAGKGPVHHDIIDGGAGIDRVGIRGSEIEDNVAVYAEPGADFGEAALFVDISNSEGRGLIEMRSIYHLGVDGGGGNDVTVVAPLYATEVINVSINAGDRFSGDDIGDLTYVYGSNDPAAANFGNESIEVGNTEVALFSECSTFVELLTSDDLENMDEFKECEGFIDGLTDVWLTYEANFGQQVTRSYHVFAANQTGFNAGDGPQDHLLVDALDGDDVITVNSVTGPTTIAGGFGNDEITAKLNPLTYSFTTGKYVSNTYFAELNIDAGPGNNWFHFDSSEYRFSPNGELWEVGGFLLERDRLSGSLHVQHGINVTATEGELDFFTVTTNRLETEVAVQSTRGNSITVINVNNDTVRVSATADFKSVGDGDLRDVNGYLFINAMEIEGQSGQSNLHVSDRGATFGNRNVGIASDGLNTFITGFAGAGDDALIHYYTDGGPAGFGDIKVEGSDSGRVLERFYFANSTGNQFELDVNNGLNNVKVFNSSLPLNIVGGPGTDRVTIGDDANFGLSQIFADIRFDGVSGFGDTLILDDKASLARRIYTVEGTTIIRDAALSIDTSSLDLIRLQGSLFDDVFDLRAFELETQLHPRVRLEGNSGEDGFAAPINQSNFWNVYGLNQFVVNRGISNFSVENVLGGNFDDTFRIVGDGSITGSIIGGANASAEFDQIDYTYLKNDVAVDLAGGVATRVSSFVGIEGFVGSRTHTGTIGGRADANVWDVTGIDQGTISLPDGQLETHFSSFQILVGNANFDLFSFEDNAYVTGGVIGPLDLVGVIDSVDFSRYESDLVVDMPAGVVRFEDGTEMIIAAIEGASTGSGNDQLIGDSADNVLFGGDGHDLIHGGDGDDWINGGNGRDLLLGANGADLIQGESGNDLIIGADTVYDISQLQMILNYWSNPRAAFDYELRTDALLEGATGELGGFLELNASVMIADGDADTIEGGDDLDWFWVDEFDIINDLDIAEIVSSI